MKLFIAGLSEQKVFQLSFCPIIPNQYLQCINSQNHSYCRKTSRMGYFSGHLVQEDQVIIDVGYRIFITNTNNWLSSQIPVPPWKHSLPSMAANKTAILKFNDFVLCSDCRGKTLYSIRFLQFQQLPDYVLCS
jgi:hypothetical protein